MNGIYNEDYYHNGLGAVPYDIPDHWVVFFGEIAKRIVNDLHPKTVLDAGCAMGYLVAALRDLGIEAYGIDISEYAISKVRDDIKPFCIAGSLTEKLPECLPQKYDLVVTIEVLEHLYAEDGEKAIANLCNYTDRILFSSTPDDFQEATHVNVQQREYWVKLFAENGFYDDINYRPMFISPQAICFQKGIPFLRLIEDYERSLWKLEKLYQKGIKFDGKIYFSSDAGESEDAKINFTAYSGEMFIHRFVLPKVCKRFRFDPIEGKGCLVSRLEAKCGNNILHPSGHNGILMNDVYIFKTIDPQIFIDVPDAENFIVDISAEIIPIESIGLPQLYEGLDGLQNSLQNCREELYEKCQDAKDLNERLTEQLSVCSSLESQITEIDKQFQESLQAERGQFQSTLQAEREQFHSTLQSEREGFKATLQTEREGFKATLQTEREGFKATLQTERVQAQNALQTEHKLRKEKESEFIEEKTKLQAELDHYQVHYNAVIAQCEELERQLAEAQNAYNVISNAFFWKITKPFRATLDLIKKNFGFRLINRGIRCLNENGVKYTWNRVLQKASNRKSAIKDADSYASDESNVKMSYEAIPQDIKFSIIVPLYNTNIGFLREMIESVTMQNYSNWELCMADGSSESFGEIREICQGYSKRDVRIKYKKLENNLGIAENTNQCAEMATGDYIVLLDHDDMLECDALVENAKAIMQTNADVLYSDEVHLSSSGKRVHPFYKPDWSVDLLYNQMYTGHLMVIRRSIFEDIHGFRSDYDGSQDYDLILRLSERTQRICHIPHILYLWREHESSTAVNPDAKPYAHVAGRNALNAHLSQKYGEMSYAQDGNFTFCYDTRFRTMENNPLVSIIIPFKDKWEMTDACVQSILDKSSYQHFEILLLDNRSEQLETYNWLRLISKRDNRIKILDADMEFNWSKLNNFGISQAAGEVYIFLNNDTLVITPDWIERMCENALRDDIGVVGCLLLYDNMTIQHAGVVVGMNGWADHIFKGMKPEHFGSPFVSPMLSRNVLAVTGACMAIAKNTIGEVGLFDESFVICGSDVEMCIRAYEKGFNNLYNAFVQLYHLESKSRDTFVPEIDFKRSYECYTPYRDNVDPYFNINLDINNVIPREKTAAMDRVNFINFLKRFPLTHQLGRAVKKAIQPVYDYTIPEITAIHARQSSSDSLGFRLNLLIPTTEKRHVFGGIATAINIFEQISTKLGCAARIILTEAVTVPKDSVVAEKYCKTLCTEDSTEKYQIVAFGDRGSRSISVMPDDIFIATAWWTAYDIAEVIRWQKVKYNVVRPLVYLIQDYEPGFYPWSSRYMLADSTYRFEFPTFAVFNSSVLHEYFRSHGYLFKKEWFFEPRLNDGLKKYLPNEGQIIHKKKQILVYGRPSVARNSFELIIYALKTWCIQQSDAAEWTILSAGEQHDDITLENGLVLHSVGKLSLSDYAKMMLDTYAGISLMVSPHPSYPPLEMSAFGIKLITNCYSNKNLSEFSENIFSLRSCSPKNIADTLMRICADYTPETMVKVNTDYVSESIFDDEMIEELATDIECFIDKKTDSLSE